MVRIFKRPLFLLIIFSYACAFSIPDLSAVYLDEETPTQNPPYSKNEIIVKFKPQIADVTSIPAINDLNKKYNVIEMTPVFKGIRKRIEKNENAAKTGLQNVYLLKMDGDADVMKMVFEYSQDPNVEYAQPNYIVTIQNQQTLGGMVRNGMETS